MISSHTVRVYYEDTDAGGVVYYANYLKYAERARTELLRKRGVDQSNLAAEESIYFVVQDVKMNIQRPAKLDDMLHISCDVVKRTGARLMMQQTITRNDETLAELTVTIACVEKLACGTFKPTRIPTHIREALPSAS